MARDPFTYDMLKLERMQLIEQIRQRERNRKQRIATALFHDHFVVLSRLRELSIFIEDGEWLDPPQVVSKHLRSDKALEAYLMTVAGVATTLMVSPRDVRNEFYRSLADFVDHFQSTRGVNGLVITGLMDMLQDRLPAQHETLVRLVTIADTYDFGSQSTYDAGLTGVMAVNPLTSQVVFLGSPAISKSIPPMMALAISNGFSPANALIPKFDKHTSIGLNNEGADTLCSIIAGSAEGVVVILGAVAGATMTFGTGGGALLAMGVFAGTVFGIGEATKFFVKTACDGFIETDEEKAAKLENLFASTESPDPGDKPSTSGNDPAGEPPASSTDDQPVAGDFPVPDEEEGATVYPNPIPEECGFRSIDLEFFLRMRQASASRPHPDGGIPETQVFVDKGTLVFDPWVDGAIKVGGGHFTSKDALRIDPPKSDAFMIKGPADQGPGTTYASRYISIDRTNSFGRGFSVIWRAESNNAVSFLALRTNGVVARAALVKEFLTGRVSRGWEFIKPG